MAWSIALSTLFRIHKPLEEALPDIEGAGCRNIEVTDDGLHALSRSRVDRLLEMKEGHGLRFSVHAAFADINIAAPDPTLREAMLRRVEASIGWAAELEAEALVFHPGAASPVERFAPGTAWRLNMASVRRLVEAAGDRGVSAMVENVPEPFPFVLKSVDDFERFFAESGLELKMALDVAHANIRGETLEFIRRLGDRVGHVHVSDNQGKRDEHLALGGGSVDWEDTMAALRRARFQGWIVVESYDGVGESLRMLEELSSRI